MNNESHSDVQAEIEQMREEYFSLKRRGAVPSLEVFVGRQPEKYQHALQKEIQEHEQLGFLFEALSEAHARRTASEVSDQEIDVARARFQQFLDTPVEPPQPQPKDRIWTKLLSGLVPTPATGLGYALLAILVIGFALFALFEKKQKNALLLQQQNIALQAQINQAIANNKSLQGQLTQTVAEKERIQQQQASAEQESFALQKQFEQVAALLFRRTMADEKVPLAIAQLRTDQMHGPLRSTGRPENDIEPHRPIPKRPVGTSVLRTTPRLQWTPVEGVREYDVHVFVKDEAEMIESVWQSRETQETFVTVPAQVLQAGQIYFWQVKAITPEQPNLSPIVVFWVLDSDSLKRVEAIEKDYPNSPLMLASAYAAYGLYEAALVEIEELANTNPTSPVVSAIRANLRRQLGRE